MITRVATLAILALIVSGWTQPNDQVLRIAGDTPTEQATASEADQLAGREMDIGRRLIERRNYTGALNRFKVVITRYRASRQFEEALSRLVDVYLALGIACEAQNAALMLGQQFPDGRWTAAAREALTAAGLEPTESKTRCY
jgi:outer membrane protein assembly factor BamD